MSLTRAPFQSRRRLRAAALGLVVVLTASTRTAGAADTTHAHPAAGPALSAEGAPGWLNRKAVDLIEPEVRRSADGVLRTELRVQYTYKDIGGYRLHLRSYEGTMPGPTLVVQPGDVLRIRLINDLPPNRDPVPANHERPHQFNTTNLHFHGGHVSPGGISDNVFRSMQPGHSYDVEFAIPSDHTRGTYWYHPHRHGSADIQITSGMAGALIVAGDFADVPEIANAKERVLILNEVLFDYLGTIEQYDTVWPEAVPRFLSVNGQREPIVRMRPGEVQRWRIIHAGHENNLRLALDGHALHAIANDGIQGGRAEAHESYVIAPGQRADLLVQAGEPGTYVFKAAANDQGYASPTGPLARVVVEGEPLTMKLPAKLAPAPLETIRDAEITGTRRLTFSAIEPEAPASANYQEFAFLVDGRLFDHNRVDHRIRLGAVEEWTVVNEHSDDHVFHIHTNPFQLTAINGQRLDVPLWRDTVIVPRNGSVTFRSRFLDFTGRFVLHCHMMNHEELGMMQVVEVYDGK